MKISPSASAFSAIRAPAVRDITAEEAAEWVAEEFHSLGDMRALETRIGIEAGIVASDVHQAGEFPMTQFAHETLLAELRAEYERQSLLMKPPSRTLH
jgi:hypothetical protein